MQKELNNSIELALNNLYQTKQDPNFISEYKKFKPNILNSLKNDYSEFKKFWELNSKFLSKQTIKSQRSPEQENLIENLKKTLRLSKKVFLQAYAESIYAEITNNMRKFYRIEVLINLVTKRFPSLLPDENIIEKENTLLLKEKEGFEIDYGIFLSSILSLEKAGLHLCHSMLLPTDSSLEILEKFDATNEINLGGAKVSRKENFCELTLTNPDFLNAEDSNTLLPMEVAIDLCLLENKTELCVFKGGTVNHHKYKGKNIFGSGINLTHLYKGKIPFLWYIIRDMGAVNKVFRGIANTNISPEEMYSGTREKLWIASLETFAIGGACQYLLVTDYIIASENSYMTLPARKEGIIPGAANLRLARFTGDRIARRAIQSGMRLESKSFEGKLICDEVVPENNINNQIHNVIDMFSSSGVVGAASNRRALRIGIEPLNNFRKYMALYTHDQAYCHFSKELIKNLEYHWDASNR